MNNLQKTFKKCIEIHPVMCVEGRTNTTEHCTYQFNESNESKTDQFNVNCIVTSFCFTIFNMEHL